MEGKEPSERSKEMDDEQTIREQQERLFLNEVMEFLDYNDGEGWWSWFHLTSI